MHFVSDGSNTRWGWKFSYEDPDFTEDHTRSIQPSLGIGAWILEAIDRCGEPAPPLALSNVASTP